MVVLRRGTHDTRQTHEQLRRTGTHDTRQTHAPYTRARETQKGETHLPTDLSFQNIAAFLKEANAKSSLF